MTLAYSLITPSDLGLPAKFKSYRRAQREALEWLMDECQTAVSAACLPTGVGKTALAVSLARLLGVKAVYLVATKALEDQVTDEFLSMGLVDVRGRSNYRCAVEQYRDCEIGSDNQCSSYNTSGCYYSNAVERAKNADLVVTNYAYWLHARRSNKTALEWEDKPIELLICDEAHALENQLTAYASVRIKPFEIDNATAARLAQSGVMDAEGASVWLEWADKAVARCGRIKERIERLHPNEYRKDDTWKDADDLEERAGRISRMAGDDWSNWVWQFNQQGAADFSPIYLKGYMGGLFSGVPRVMLMSASLTMFTMNQLLSSDGVDSSYDYRAWSQVFPPQNAPVYHIPTRKLSWKSTDEDYQEVIRALDEVIDHRMDRNHIIHTVSYDRARRTLAHSRHAQRFVWNETGSGLSGALERFRAAGYNPPAILVTPSVEESFNFPGRECEVQHFIKFPFPNETSRVIKERCSRISGYRLHTAAQRFYQMCGRGRRFSDDRCENFCYDNSVKQLTGMEGRSYLPPGFRIFTVTAIPTSPPRAPESGHTD